jgi:16S rRNA U516 pseudouridylate synthase RsuA-like enzyme
MRINKYLSLCGLGSRRKVEELVEKGRIRVNGDVVRDLSCRIDPDTDTVELDGAALNLQRYYYIMLNKPKGYITSVSDELGRAVVMNLIPEKYRRAGVVPVGRLDKDSEGLLLLTNDGDIAYRLTPPALRY